MILSSVIFIPVFFLLVIIFLPPGRKKLFQVLTILSAGLQFIMSMVALFYFRAGNGAPAGVNNESGFQLVEKSEWIRLNLGNLGILKIDYFLGLDGLNLPLMIMSTGVLLIASISSWKINFKEKGYFILFLLLNASVMGCFLALDFFLFYLFFEFMLLPMYFLIGIWGGPRREYAAIKFFLYTLVGSVLVLVVMIGLYLSVFDPVATGIEAGMIHPAEGRVSPEQLDQVRSGVFSGDIPKDKMVRTFNMITMMNPENFIPGSILGFSGPARIFGMAPRLVAFLFLLVGFAIKLPAVPFHTWLPDAHVEAPTPISVILAAILLKIGGYGIIRIAYGIFPEGGIHYAYLIGMIGVISIIYGAYNALAMKDLKKLIAYSSVSHMGFVLLGLSAFTVEAVNGAIFQMFSHGILSAMLFLIAGVLYDRTHNRMIENYNGLANRLPRFTAVVVVAFFASLGLPGFSGFIGEILILLGSFRSMAFNQLIPIWMPLLATLGLLLGAAYFLWTLQRMFFGTYWVKESLWENQMFDLDTREHLMFIPLIAATLLFGILPGLITGLMENSVTVMVNDLFQTGINNLNILFQN